MALQLGALRDALVDAGAKPEMARAAAEEAAGYENRLASIDGRLASLEQRIDTRLASMELRNETRFAGTDLRIERVEGKITLSQWQLGVLIAGVASLVLKAFL